MVMHRSRSKTREKGAVLIISMVVLLLLTLLGVTSMRSTTVEERIAGNLRDQNLAFQGSEAALTEAQRLVSQRPDLFGPPDQAQLPGFYVRAYLENELVDGPHGPLMPDADDEASWENENRILLLGNSVVGNVSMLNMPELTNWSARFRVEKQPFFDADPGRLGEPLGGNASPTVTSYRLQSRSRGGSGAANIILESQVMP